MFHRTNLIYRYDGSFDGLLTCIFTCYEQKEWPLDIVSDQNVQDTLCPARTIDTDSVKASRVAAVLPQKLSKEGAEMCIRDSSKRAPLGSAPACTQERAGVFPVKYLA